jgi:hypothetical protein
MNAATTLLDPAVLFFVLGAAAGLLRSNLAIPDQIARFLSLYLLMSVGLKGGFELAHGPLNAQVLGTLGLAMLLAVLVPAAGWLILRRWLPPMDALAVAATYGSVSATTFIAASQYLAQVNMPHGGHMAVALVLMESPAALMAVLAATWLRSQAARSPVSAGLQSAGSATLALGGGGRSSGAGAPAGPGRPSWAHLAREALTDGAQLLLLGSLLIGLLTGETGKAMMEPFSGALFKGMLSLFLMDMGLTVARQWRGLADVPRSLLAYAVLAPLAHASLAIALARWAGLPAGDAILLAVLAGSSSYIVVPAVLQQSLPEARPALYLGMSLGVTFGFNILFGIPLYTSVVTHLWGA